MQRGATPSTLAEWLESRGSHSPATIAGEELLRAVAHADSAFATVSDATLREVRERELVLILGLLDQLQMDDETLAATIFHEVDVNAATVLPEKSPLLVLIDGQQAAERVWSLHVAHAGGNAEGLRRLLLAIVRDLRVVFILLARQLVRMRLASTAPEDERRALAQMTADIHAPLANRLGIWQVKWELEDLAFRYLQPDTYRRVVQLLDERRGNREDWIEGTKQALRGALANAGIAAEISGRPKHIYSIWKKMQRKGVDFSDLYDIRAVRVLVADVPTCYAALGVVHALWPYIPGEFDDYIANPKGNHYQSLHTAVIGLDGRTLEVQFRSHAMHEHAELGVAAHWRYKEGGSGDASFERKVAWMRQLLENKDDRDDDAALLAGFRTDVLDDRVYLLTPKGEVKDLPRGATVLDFAYLVHTDVGHRCRGAKVNGRIVPLHFQPATGDRIEVLTGKTIEPHRDWLSSHHGYLNTPRAREKVRAWFKRTDFAQNVAVGRAILDRELKRLALPATVLDALPAKFKLANGDELYEALALGDVSAGQVARALHEMTTPAPALAPRTVPPLRKRGSNTVIIEGVGNLLTTLARCCQPVPGDPISGFLTIGRGVTVHRGDCAQLARQRQRNPDRIIDAHWGDAR
ncbi:MAG: bifunctional (p)ppGpp synthetase/guanosine-3',5'-bis(diphosphate) 3'-pyrophosphohydrolase, partial [Dokdonella sp.]